VALTPTERLILLYVEVQTLKEQPPPTRAEVAEGAGIPRDTLKKLIPDLRRRGLLSEETGLRLGPEAETRKRRAQPSPGGQAGKR
jgi:DNA-binding IscR family transcriptional regulator